MKKFIILMFLLLCFCINVFAGGPLPINPPPACTDAQVAAGTSTTPCTPTPKQTHDTYSGATAEVSDATVGVAGDTDTTHAYSKDDIHDYVAQHDSDYDGLPDGVEAGAITAAMVAADVATQSELDTVAALVDTDDEIIAIINASPSTQIGVPAGGMGSGTHTDGGLLVGAGTSAVEALAVGLTTQILVGGGSGTNPAWGTDLPTAVTIGSAYIYRAGGTDVPDADVADDITASNYLPLSGTSAMTGELTAAIGGIEFQETDTISDCSSFAATGGGIFYDDSEGKFKKCQDNVLTDLDTTSGGSVSISGTPAQYEWAEWTDASTIKGTAVTGSKVVCTDANGSPIACTNLTDVAFSGYLALSGGTMTDTLVTDASDATASGLRLPHGAAPSSPTNGDLWTTTSGLYARINGSTVGPFVEAAGSTNYDSIGDPTGVGLITFDDGETATYDGAWDTETAITISLNAADLTGDTTALLITAVDNDDANYIPFLIQDDQDGTPDDLFKVDYQGVATAAGGFVGNVTGNASGSAASITGDLDPDQLSGDTVDDNLIDQEIIAGLSTAGTATPGFTAYDSGAPGADKEIGKVYWNDDGTGGDGTEDGDFFIQAMVAGSETNIIAYDNSASTVTVTPALVASNGITGNLTGNASGSAGSVAVGNITGAGTGILAALAINVGSAGAPVILGGALGTPSSGDATNLLTPSSTSLPGTCTVGQQYLDTDADTNGSLYICIATNTWKEVDDDGGAGGLATEDIDTSAELVTIVTDETGSASGTPLLVFNQAPQIDDIELGHATDTTLHRVSAGVVSVEGNTLLTNAANTIDSDQYVDGSIDPEHLSTVTDDDGICFVIDGGGSAITTGIKGDLEIPYGATISAVTMLLDQSATMTVDIWKDTYANFPPTDADSITASAVPGTSAAAKDQDTTLTGWTTSITKGDILRYNVDANDNATRCTICLRVDK